MKANTREVTQPRLQQMLYPVVRMRAKNAGGSGTVIFSGRNEEGKCETYVIGCHHVIADCISVSEEWRSILGRKIKVEHLSTVYVEPFRYNEGSRCVGGAASLEADIVAYDERQDMALLRLRDSEREFEHVAYMMPKGSLSEIQVTNEVWAAGAGLGHMPMVTYGHVQSIDDEIEDVRYFMSSAHSIFGHSGGAVFRYTPERDRYEFIGIPARITVMPKGFMGFETVSWMGYAIPIQRIYAFLEEHCYDFIFDPDRSMRECTERRRKKKTEAQRVIDRMYGVVEEQDSP